MAFEWKPFVSREGARASHWTLEGGHWVNRITLDVHPTDEDPRRYTFQLSAWPGFQMEIPSDDPDLAHVQVKKHGGLFVYLESDDPGPLRRIGERLMQRSEERRKARDEAIAPLLDLAEAAGLPMYEEQEARNG